MSSKSVALNLHPLSPDRLEALLGLDPAVLDLPWLKSAGWLEGDQLPSLLAAAREEMGRRPAAADRLALACRIGAEHLQINALRCAADHVLAQARAIQGDFVGAQVSLDRARAGFLAMGDDVGALRTDLGRINILNMLGSHAEAVAVADDLLRALTSDMAAADRMDDLERRRMMAAALSNRGICLRHLGRLEEALPSFDDAVLAFESLQLEIPLADARVNRALGLVSLARPREALSDLESAAGVFAAVGHEHARGRALCNLGHARLALGLYEGALDDFSAATESFVACGAPPLSLAVLALDQAEAHLALNLVSEARQGFVRASDLLSDDGSPYELGRASWGLGAASLAAGDLDGARAALDAALERFEAGGNGPQKIGVLLSRARLAERTGDAATAKATADAALARAEAEHWEAQAALAALTVADLAVRQADLMGAEQALGRAAEGIETLGLGTLQSMLWQLRGQILRRQGRPTEAEVALREAIGLLERLRGGLGRAAWRRGFLEDKTIAYEELVGLLLERGEPGDTRSAFAVAEQAKSRTLAESLLSLVDAGVASGRVRDTDELDELKAELSAVYSSMLGTGSTEAERAAPMRSLQARAVELETAIDRIAGLAGMTGPDWDPSKASSAVDPGSVELGEAVLSYHIAGGQIHAFVLRGSQVTAHTNLAGREDVAEALRRLGVQLDRFRIGSDFVARHRDAIQRSTDRALEHLYDLLFRPILPLLEGRDPDADGIQRLTIVPHGILHQVPFAALRSGTRHLVDDYELVLAPSVTVRNLCQERQRPDIGTSLVFGAADERIPAALREARQVADLLPDSQLFEGEDAGREQLRLALKTDAVAYLHLACHGLFRADNPQYSALKLADGWLLAREVEGYRLDGAVVVLSACESGRAEVTAGDEILGLSRAFLSAGATTLVVSQWLVHDDSAAELMSHLYASLREGKDPAAALRSAQLALRAARPHPYYWAPFVVIGRR